MTSQHGQCRNLVRAFLSWVLPIPATPPYAVRPLHMHGATDYGRYHLGGLKMLAVRSGKVVRDIPWRPWAARIQAGRGCPEFLAGLGSPGGQRAAPKAGRKGSTRRAIRYAQCVLEDRGAKCEGKQNRFRTSAKRAHVAPEPGCEIHYAQRCFVNVSALERTMLPMTRSTF